ncbi:MAG: membrane protein insertion efficiency factor YidD [Nitrospirae bacterium]|nr:membrane protein insertion efficiency factor YidD [Nitrospirota bacterium]
MRTILLVLIEAYRAALSPFLGSACRFYPSCSQYAGEAIQEFGAWKGARLAIRRVLRCHPFHPGGYDPVPDQGAPRP